MTTKVFTKRHTQQVIRDMRGAGYTVSKIAGGYESNLDGELIFKAMVGPYGYLVRYDDALLTAAA